ncbi:unnamed protein product [Linum trigynum]|uniref:KIB1-4 beta-propeller domain-containing protein n=1 Tax=Linum trigynum TaxID=586398 RepID=A0AAV2FN22_9ROSI
MGILVACPSAWAELEAGLLAEIAKRIPRLSDYASFATVCSSWRNAALPEERRRRPWAHFPGLLISSRRREKKPGDRFLPVAQIRNYLGNQKSHYGLRRAFLQPAAAAAGEEWDCRGTQEGWVVMVKPYEDGNRAMNVTLRDPLTHVDIALPPLHAGVSTAPVSWRVEKAVLSSYPGADSSGRCYVLMFHDLRVTELITVRLVSLCEVGADESWRDVEFTEMPIDHQDYSIDAAAPPPPTAWGGPPPALDDRDAIYINGNNSSNFYILNRGILHLLDPSAAEARTTVVCRIEGKLPVRQTKWRESFHLNHYFYSAEAGCHVVPHFHLAELGGGDELAVVVRLVGYSPGQGETGVRKFVVYTWRRSEDGQGYYWDEASDLGGGAALFVGTCQASVTLRRPGVNVAAKRDHIYFALFSPANASGVEIGEYNYLRRRRSGGVDAVHLFKFGPSTIEPQDLALSSSSIDGKSTRKRCEDGGEEMDCTCAAATIHSGEAGGDENDEQYAFATATNRFEALLTL